MIAKLQLTALAGMVVLQLWEVAWRQTAGLILFVSCQGAYLAHVGSDDVGDVVDLICTPVVEAFACAPARAKMTSC